MSPKRAWALYDWANSAYATTVMAGFFPVFFKQYWAGGLTVNESTFWLGAANAGASVVVALLAPVLGAIADQGGIRKRLLLRFTALGVATTAALFFVAQGAWVWAALVYALGNIGFSGAVVFYDALIVDVAERRELDRTSALGYAFGYVGGGLLFALNVGMTLRPHWFGLADASEAVRWSFLTVALWWALFSLPLARSVRERRPARRAPLGAVVRAGWRQFVATFRHVRRYRPVLLFLAAYFLYIDAVGTIIRMAVDFGLSLGFSAGVMVSALLLTQFVAFPAAYAFGFIGAAIGARRGIFICIAVYVGVCLWSTTMENERDFYLLAGVVGLVMGGIQALSRSFYARIIPREAAAEFFGFFNMLGKFAAVLGPLLMGAASWASGSARFSIVVLVVLFAAGAWLLRGVEEGRAWQSGGDVS